MRNILYNLQTRGLGDFFILSTDPTSAEKMLNDELNNSQYGFNDDRHVHTITIVCTQIERHDDGKLFFSSKHTLII